jgi:leucyl-tRNA synthetase
MPQWAGSCWYYLRFLDPHNSKRFCAPEIEKYWMPVDMYIGGAEHAVLHLLYARFWHKVLFDLGFVSHPEPFSGLFNQGMIQGEAYKNADGRLLPAHKVKFIDGQALDPETGDELTRVVVKMSKSLGNVINPDEVIREHGADALRLYLMSMGPLEKNKPWDTQAITGVTRFLNRVWVLIVGEPDSPHETPCRPRLIDPDLLRDAEVEQALQRTIARVTQDIEDMRFNTALSHLMIFVNLVASEPERLHRDQAERFVKVLSPFAPHIAEELWLRLANTDLLAVSPWPTWDENLIKDSVVTLAIQINGKLRGTVPVAADASEHEVIIAAREAVAKSTHVQGKSIIRHFYIPGRVVNFLVE